MTSIINTKRIVLKKFTENDVDLLFELDSDPEVMKYITLGKTKTLNEIKNKFMPRVMQSYKNGQDYGIFSAYLITDNSFIGWFQFEPDKLIKDAVEIGWRLKKECWGNGYATEGAKALVEKGLKLNKIIVARAMAENIASINIMKKIGLEFAEEFWGHYQPNTGPKDVRYELVPKI